MEQLHKRDDYSRTLHHSCFPVDSRTRLLGLLYHSGSIAYPSLAPLQCNRSYNLLLLIYTLALHSKGKANHYFSFLSELDIASNCILSPSVEHFTCGFSKTTSSTTFLSHQKVLFDVALCEDNELIMRVGKLSGIANYGVNAVERNRIRDRTAALPRWDARGCAHMCTRLSLWTNACAGESFFTCTQAHVGEPLYTCVHLLCAFTVTGKSLWNRCLRGPR